MPAVSPSRPIAVIGAGIAGMTLALDLARRGFKVVIFEEAPRLEEVGAGLQLAPNALSVYDRLGLLEPLRVHACPAETVTLRAGRSGKAIAEIPVGAADGTRYVSIHRADLQKVLHQAVERHPSIDLHLGHPVQDVTRQDDDVLVRFAEPADRPSFRTPFCIAADGVHSTVAKRLGLDGEVSTGFVAWRTDIPQIDTAFMTGIQAWLGPHRHAVAYPIAAGRSLNLVLIERAATMKGDAEDTVRRRFAGWNGRLRAVIAKAETLRGWPLAVVPPDRPWRHFGDRLLLIGDAAHALLPYAAQGAGMAIEDAAVLGDCLETARDLPDALARYEGLRRPRIDRLRKRGDFHRFVYHVPPPLSWARDRVLAMRSQESLARDLSWLYDWRPPA